VVAAVRQQRSIGAGYIERNGQQYLVRVPGQVSSLQELRNIVLDRRDGVPIRVHDVAEVGEGSGAAHRRRHAGTVAKWCWARCSC
jgi:cobalt-zinc-cadmium resistance protein CzcA